MSADVPGIARRAFKREVFWARRSAIFQKSIFSQLPVPGFLPEAIKGLKTSKCPFTNLPESRKSPYAMTEEVMRQCVWVRREQRCEVEFVERTKGGRLRHAEFRRLVL